MLTQWYEVIAIQAVSVFIIFLDNRLQNVEKDFEAPYIIKLIFRNVVAMVFSVPLLILYEGLK